MKVVVEESNATSWVTVIALVGLIVVGAIAYQNRERFLPSAKATPKPTSLKLSEETERKFFDARDAIVAGKYAEASSILTAIDTDKVPQPTRNWMTLQNGLAYLLAGKLPEAKAEFAKVEKRGPYTTDPRQEKLAKFFVETGRLASSAEPQTSDVVKNYDMDSTEAFALLIFGLKDWEMGEFEDASFLLRQFRSASPPDSEIWLRRYKQFGDAYVDSFSAFQVAEDAAKDASGDERKKLALDQIRAAKAKIKGQPGLIAKLSTLEGTLKTQVEAADAAMSKATEAAEAADKQIIADVKQRVAVYNEKFNFADAHQIVFTATVEGDKAKAELEEWFKRTQWLSKFKSTLASDITANGYAKPLTKKDSTVLATGVKTADDAELLTDKKVPVQWSDITSDSIIAMAKEFIAKETAADVAADRKWWLGNYVYQLGRKAEALALMNEAVKGKPEYKESLRLFPDGGAK